MNEVEKEHLLNSALMALDKENFSSAQEYLNQVLQVENSNAFALRLMGISYIQIGKNEIALEYFKRSINSNSTDPYTWSNLGDLLLISKNFSEAINAYENSIKLNEHIPEVWTNKGNALFELKNYKEAIVSHEKAIAINPNSYEAWNNKSITQLKLKNFVLK